MPDIRLRSVLFAPANRADLTAKLPRSGPDGAVLDLEDAVPAAAKGDARAMAHASATDLVAAHPEVAWFVRVNAVSGPWFAGDIAEALTDGLTGIVVPKLETRDQVHQVHDALGTAGRRGLAIIAGLETAAGVEAAPEVLGASGVVAGYFGAEDYIADVGGIRTEAGDEVLYARSRVAAAGRIGRTPVIDQIVADFSNDDRFRADAALGRNLGYRGKLCIHPGQVALAHAAFTPSPSEIDRARRLVDAYAQATEQGVAAIDFEGEMVDEPLVRQARAILTNAGEDA